MKPYNYTNYDLTAPQLPPETASKTNSSNPPNGKTRTGGQARGW